jgi:hypothetical protein
MSQHVEATLDRLCMFSIETDVDEDAREIVMAIDLVATEFMAWCEAVDIAPDSVHPTGTPELRSAIRALRNTCTEVKYPLPESISELMKMAVPDEQICKMYGFLNEDGSIDLSKLSEEKAAPGTHYDRKTWKPPHLKRQQAEVNQRWSHRQPVDYRPVSEQQIESQRGQVIDPTPIEDLVGLGVKSEQIARMKGMTIEAVQDYAAENGLPLDGKIIRPQDMTADDRDQLSREQSDLIPKSHPEIDALEDRILACLIDDMKPVEIATALQVDFPELTWQKVVAIGKNLEAEAKKHEEQEKQKA